MNGDSRGGAGRGRLGPLHGAMAAGLLSAALVPGPAAAMDFREVPAAPGCPQVCLVAEGSIDPDTARRFEDLVRQGQFSEGATVALDSLGGRMAVGISLGEAIRKHGFATLVGRYDAQANRFGPGTCASACIFTLMGGVRRSVAAGSRVGVHEVHVDRSPHADPANAAQLLMGLGGDHLRKCGATVDLLILALATPPEEIRWLSRAELVRYRVVTDELDPGGGPEGGPNDPRRLEVSAIIRYRLLGAQIHEVDMP